MQFMDLFQHWFPIMVTIASVASAALPAPKVGSFGYGLVALINLLGLNVGHAANATPASLKTESNNTSLTNTISVFVAGVVLSFMLAWPSDAVAATQITLLCTPQGRVGGGTLATTDIGGYLYTETDLGKALATLGNEPASPTPSTYSIAIPSNTCFKAGTVFGCSVSDTLGQWSAPGTSTLASDACNALPKPASPSVTITVQ